MLQRILVVIAILVFAVGAHAEITFGESVGSLKVGLEASGAGQVKVQVKNEGMTAARLEGAFVWVLLVQDRENAFYTAKAELGNGSESLAPGAMTEKELRLSDIKPYRKGIKVVQGYPVSDETAVPADQVPASLRGQAILYIRHGGEALTVKSRAVPLRLRGEEVEGGAELQNSLLDSFRRDAFSASAAHDRAVALGEKVLPILREGLADETMPAHGLMWLATAVIHIGGQTGAQMASGLADHKNEGVRHVVAYHGPAMKNAAVDKAIIEEARKGDDPVFTAWAARGFNENKREFPEKLVELAAGSKEPRARAEIAAVVASRLPDPQALKRLILLVGDQHELVRVAAADAAKRYKVEDASVLRAMAQSLDLPGEAARQRVIEALAELLGEKWAYDPQEAEAQRVATVNRVQARLLKRDQK